jgi:hypothetical protein
MSSIVISKLTNKICNIEVYQGILCKFYIIDDQKYHIKFPLQWAVDHLYYDDEISRSGPKDCWFCRNYGCIKNIFIGYCMLCYDNIYRGSRGGRIKASIITNETIKRLWKAFPYMEGEKLCDIGDVSKYILNCMDKKDVENKKKKEYIKKPILIHNNNYEDPKKTKPLSLKLPSLLDPKPEIYSYKPGQILCRDDLEKINMGIPLDYNFYNL